MKSKLFKSTLLVSGFTLISRILGFIRDMLLARLFGVSAETDAFYIAFKIPNFLRRLFIEGAFAQALVPAFSNSKQDNIQQHHQFINHLAGVLSLWLMGLTILGMLTAPLLIKLFAPGFEWRSGQFELAVEVLRICMPYLFFIGGVAVSSSLLNAYQKFALTAFTPALLNICMISAAYFLAPRLPQAMTALAWGVLAAGILQFLVQLPALIQLGILPRLYAGFKNPEVRRSLANLLPSALGASISQVNLLLDSVMASLLPAGSVSWLYYSDRIVEFPLGIIGIAIGTVILPNLSINYANNETEKFQRALDWGLRWILLIGLPTTLGISLLANPILSSFFEYGEFNQYDMQQTSYSLIAYTFGLIGLMLIKVLTPAFSARHDMRSPMRYGLYALAANCILNLILMQFLAHAGLALATSIAAYINAGLLFFSLYKNQVYRATSGWPRFILQLVIANLLLALFLYYGTEANKWQAWTLHERFTHLALVIGGAIPLYFSALFLLGLRPKDLLIH